MSLRDQLASKKPHVTSVTFPVGDAGEKAAREYAEALERLEMLKLLNTRSDSKTDMRPAEAAVKKTLTAYKKASITLRFRGLTAVERDNLASEFSPEEDDAKVDVPAYTAALLALATLDSDLTAAEWKAELYESGRWSDGEVDAIRDAARSAYEEVAAPGIPKD